MIRKHAESKRNYSKTYAETNYTPLTMNDKMKFLEDLNQNSDQRLMLYSNLFNEIKTHISFLSNNIQSPLNKERKSLNEKAYVKSGFGKGAILENENSVNMEEFNINGVNSNSSNKKGSHTKNTSINHSLEEKDQVLLDFNSNEDFNSKNKKKVITTHSGFMRRRSKSLIEFDWRDIDENIGIIMIPQVSYNCNIINKLNVGTFAVKQRQSKSLSPKKMNEKVKNSNMSSNLTNNMIITSKIIETLQSIEE